jgi:hypothetical protein
MLDGRVTAAGNAARTALTVGSAARLATA